MASAADHHETNGGPNSSDGPEFLGVDLIVARRDEVLFGLRRAAHARRVGESDDVFPEGLRYWTIFVRVDWTGGEPAVREREACVRWSWFRWDDAPEPLFVRVAGLQAKGFGL